MKTFSKGGVHPNDNKLMSSECAIESIDLPDKLIISMSQHLGKEAKPIVIKGDIVQKGQCIAKASGFISADVHAPTSGTIHNIFAGQSMQGKSCTYIELHSDGKDEWYSQCNQPCDWQIVPADELKKIIAESGVVGMGGATFPTHVKLSPMHGVTIDTLIINGVECEPYLTCDHQLMREHSAHIVVGIQILKKALGVDNAIIGIEANKHDAYDIMRAATKDTNILVELLNVKYPQGAEKQLIDALMNRQVPSGKLPMHVGCVVQNIATAFAVYEAVAMKRPLTHRIITISGDGIEQPANLYAPIGTSFDMLLQRQGLLSKATKLISGGPMMGTSISDTIQFMTKGSSGLLAFCDAKSIESDPCIRCGRCVSVCPVGCMPVQMMEVIAQGDIAQYADMHIADCIECGSCSYICPAHRHLLHYIRQAKSELVAERIKKDRAAKKKEAANE